MPFPPNLKVLEKLSMTTSNELKEAPKAQIPDGRAGLKSALRYRASISKKEKFISMHKN